VTRWHRAETFVVVVLGVAWAIAVICIVVEFFVGLSEVFDKMFY